MKKYIFIIILLFAISYALLAISYKPYAALAQVKLETGLPNIPGGQLPVGQELPSYIKYFFIFGLGFIAILALAQMMVGGLTYILAAGNVAKVEDAKDTIKQALLGLGLLLVSYLLLRTINPDLVNLRNPNLTPTQFKTQIQTQTQYVETAAVGQPCPVPGGVSTNGLICQNGKWETMVAPPTYQYGP